MLSVSIVATMAVEIDIESKAEGQYRIVVWTIGPSVERKYSKLVELGADVVVAARSGSEVRLLKANRNAHSSMAWVGRHVQRGLGVIGFDRSRVRLDAGKWDQRLEWIAPITVTGPIAYSMLAVWALNEKAQVSFKSKPPASQPHQMMRLYKSTLEKPTVVAGDFNNNPIFHRNDPNWDMLELIALLKANGLVSAYHEFNELEHGDPREQPTRFRPDPIGGTDHHHVDYCFIPREWMPSLRRVQIGQPDNWFREVRAEEHVPVAFDFDSTELSEIVARQREKSAS